MMDEATWLELARLANKLDEHGNIRFQNSDDIQIDVLILSPTEAIDFFPVANVINTIKAEPNE